MLFHGPDRNLRSRTGSTGILCLSGQGGGSESFCTLQLPKEGFTFETDKHESGSYRRWLDKLSVPMTFVGSMKHVGMWIRRKQVASLFLFLGCDGTLMRSWNAGLRVIRVRSQTQLEHWAVCCVIFWPSFKWSVVFVPQKSGTNCAGSVWRSSQVGNLSVGAWPTASHCGLFGHWRRSALQDRLPVFSHILWGLRPFLFNRLCLCGWTD